MKNKNHSIKIEQSDQQDSKTKKLPEQYKCGDQKCGKFYHSYTAFYNHCKKSHEGQFPKNSLLNDKQFQGPTKNRGRPRIKKNEAKDMIQIESMKKQNQLIEFMGTLQTKKSQQLIVYVQNPSQHVQQGTIQVREWLRRQRSPISQQCTTYLQYIKAFNKTISQNDLPQFYDPIQTHLYPDKLDSYSFSSVYNFMIREDMRIKHNVKLDGEALLYKIYLCWSARILSQKLFNQLLFIVMQVQLKITQTKEKEHLQKQALEFLFNKRNQLKSLICSFFQHFMKEHDRSFVPPKANHLDNKKNHVLSDKKFASDQDQEDD